jgi:tight adherence protein B
MSAARQRLRRIMRRPGSPAVRRPTRLPGAVVTQLARRPRVVTALIGACVGLAAAAMAGVVAGIVATAYAGLITATALRRRRREVIAREQAQAIETVSELASDLRAGLPTTAIIQATQVIRKLDQATAACMISERLGSPLADLLDRVEADLRAAQALRASVRAQTAGTQATAALLAALPLAGVALGLTLGVDPIHSLLHTQLGAACVLGGLVLQLTGLGWTSRLVAGAVRGMG